MQLSKKSLLPEARIAMPAILLLFTLAVLSLILARPMPDEGIPTTGGWLLLHGVTLYSEFFSMYAPGVYFIMAAFYAFFPVDFVASRLFSLAVNLVSLAAFFLLARKLMSEKPAIVATFLYATWALFTMSWNILIEPFITLFAILLAYFLLSFMETRQEKHLSIVGVLLSTLTLMKQTMLFLSVLAFAFLVLRVRLSRRQVFLLVVSYAILPLLFLTYLFYYNALLDFIYQAIIYNLTHSSLFSFRFRLDWIAIALFFFMVPSIALILYLGKRLPVSRGQMLFLLIWLVAAIPTLLPILGCCSHFTPLLPLYAIFFGLILQSLFVDKADVRLVSLDLAPLLKVAMALIFILSVAGPSLYLSQYFLQNDFEDLFELACYVKDNSSPEDYLYVSAYDAEMYFFAQRKMATQYIFDPFLFPEEKREFQVESISQLEETKPKFVIDFSGSQEALQGDSLINSYILENYSIVKTKALSEPLYGVYYYGFVMKRK